MTKKANEYNKRSKNVTKGQKMLQNMNESHKKVMSVTRKVN